MFSDNVKCKLFSSIYFMFNHFLSGISNFLKCIDSCYLFFLCVDLETHKQPIRIILMRTLLNNAFLAPRKEGKPRMQL